MNVFEENVYENDYIESLVDDDAISHEEALFLEGYNA